MYKRGYPPAERTASQPLEEPSREGRALPRLLQPLILGMAFVATAGCGALGRQAEPTASATSAPLRFADVRTAAGIDFRHDHGGSGERYYPETMGAGCAILDFDQDGWNDLYFVQGAPLPGCERKSDWRNRLYRGGPGWSFTDVTDAAGVDGMTPEGKLYGIGCATGDVDNDGFTDLLVTGFGGCILYRNNGNGSFSDISRRAGLTAPGFWSSAAFLDFDRDGKLDLYVCRYVSYRIGDDAECGATQGIRSYCSPKSFPGATSRLYRNVGAGVFRDVTRQAGVEQPQGKSLGVISADFDGNGWPDLYVANDTVRNFLFQNHGGRFTERAFEAGVAVGPTGVAFGGMGVAAEDVDGDLRPDLLITNFRMEPSTLFHNQGGSFQERGASWGLARDSYPWVGFGCAVADFDLDGLRDVAVVNGHVLDNPEAFSTAERHAQPGLLYQQRNAAFVLVPDPDGLSVPRVARGLAAGDLDNDGDPDLVVAVNHGVPALLRNEQQAGRRWLQIRAMGGPGNRSAIGARVSVNAGGRTQAAEVRSASSYTSAGDLRLTFGLGQARRAEALEIRWPSGRVERLKDVPSNQLITVREKPKSPPGE